MLRTKITKLHLSPISLHSASSVRIPSSVKNVRYMLLPLDYLLLGHLLSGNILNHLMHPKDAECIIMFLSAMPRGVCCTHLCTKTTITLSVNGQQFSIINNNDMD